MQSSSHNCPIDSKDPVAKSLNRNTCWALSVRSEDRCIFACDVGVMTSPFATLTCGPNAGLTLLQNDIASSLK